MPRKCPFYTEFFHPPFTEDVEELLARFQHTDSVRYEVFSSIWRDMAFSAVFYGLPILSEMRRFCRITLATAVKYFLPPYSYQIRVGGLYLMYGLYHTQLAISPENIRISLKDWSHVEKFLKDSAHSGHYDVIYIYQKLVAMKAIHYTAMPHVLNFQKHKNPKKESVCVEFIGRSTTVQDLLSADILDEMTNVQNHYEKIKAGVAEVHSQASMTHRDFVTNLKDCMSEFIVWQSKTFSKDKRINEEDDEEKAVETECASSRAQLLSSIKQKSYSNFQGTSKARRHRQVEVVSDTISGPEEGQKAATGRKRPVSLFRRTKNKLGVSLTKKKLNNWLLTFPEGVPEDRALPSMMNLG